VELESAIYADDEFTLTGCEIISNTWGNTEDNMAKRNKKDVQFVGVAIEDVISHTEAELKAGQFDDGTKIKPQVREALSSFTNSMRSARALPRHYVLVWNRYIFIKIDF
jgi:hypothetical protein